MVGCDRGFASQSLAYGMSYSGYTLANLAARGLGLMFLLVHLIHCILLIPRANPVVGGVTQTPLLFLHSFIGFHAQLIVWQKFLN